jgi:hypothetical protein
MSAKLTVSEEIIMSAVRAAKRRGWGISADITISQDPDDDKLCCPIGAVLLKQADYIDLTTDLNEAAGYIGRSRDWVNGFISGFDDVAAAGPAAFICGKRSGTKFRRILKIESA